MQKENIEIVVIEDEADLLELLEYHLKKEGYQVSGFLSAEHVEQFLEEENPSIMIVDRNLPNIEGSQFVKNLRQKGYDIPIIFLSAKDSDEDIEEGFEIGGDDYITKPFNPKELLLRINALLKRSGLLNTREKYKYKSITLDCASRSVLVDTKDVSLTNLEFEILLYFMKNISKVIDRDTLYDLFWNDKKSEPNYNAINVAITRLKKKIDNDSSSYIKSVWGSGYKFE
ncbi:Phosphate regulon transcriptional regulatory protein phoB [Sulfurovum sp. enrichment culture clone C5]|uniref:Phosphate regulon transcriptional regulatory protein phoB n=1 Tax=Sulfurovum sp. enrichment culture clone C5 TaxID=497650 RepID=A0A0S4XPW2_9BACT|nr:Phosphate regulon transcriptional regulatory protein phoB [Sulfurovum sp. enrichment culture clone C5]